MEKNIRLVVFEHLSDKLDIHVLDINFLGLDVSKAYGIKEMASKNSETYLKILIEYHHSFIELFLVEKRQINMKPGVN